MDRAGDGTSEPRGAEKSNGPRPHADPAWTTSAGCIRARHPPAIDHAASRFARRQFADHPVRCTERRLFRTRKYRRITAATSTALSNGSASRAALTRQTGLLSAR